MNLTFGTDPEFFASYNENGKDYVIPPVHFRKYCGINPIKDDPKHPEFIHTKDGVVIHQDGVAFEFKIPPVKDAKTLHTFVTNGLDALNEFVSKFGFNIYTKPTINFDINKWKDEDDDFKYCLIFGCDRDWDAFDFENYNSPEINAAFHAYRYGGGHLHISGEELISENPLPMIRLLATTVGNYVTAKSLFPDLDRQRVFLYGKPGKFRPQNYPDGTKGIEYRTPSNTWLSSLELMEGVFHYANKAVNYLLNPEIGRKILMNLSNQSVDAIMNCNQSLALENLSQLE